MRKRFLVGWVVVMVVVGGLAVPVGAGFTDVFMLEAEFGSPGTGNGEFSGPSGVAVDSDGNVYVADTNVNRIQKFDSSYGFVATYGQGGGDDGEFFNPYGVAIDGAGNFYVADTFGHRIQKFSSTGDFVTKWGGAGNGDGQVIAPHGLVVHPNGNVYVADTNNDRIQVFAPTGTFVAKWGTEGSADGEFSNPRGVAVDSDGNVYVADTANHRIQRFDSDGVFVAKWGSYGTGDGEMREPTGVAVDGDGNVYVADNQNDRIQKFTSDGVFITKYGDDGGENLLANPHGVAVDADGFVYIADTLSHRILVLAQPSITMQPVGIGTGSPGGDLQVSGDDGTTQVLVTETSGTTAERNLLELENNGAAGIRLSDTSAGDAWNVVGGGSFSIGDTSTTPVLLESGAPTDSLVLTPNGLGIGTAGPEFPLHVLREDGSAKVVVEDTGVTVAVRELFELINNGGAQFVFTDSDTGNQWQFSQNGNGNFTVSRKGSIGPASGVGGAELLISTNGRVKMGPGGDTTFDLLANGNLTITGALTENSDLYAKTDISGLDAGAVLEAVVGLPIAEWSYADDPGVRHVGPMAQDFHAAFGLGASETGIATLDTSGVALASIQALAADNRVLELWVGSLTVLVAGLMLVMGIGWLRRRETPLPGRGPRPMSGCEGRGTGGNALGPRGSRAPRTNG